MTSSLLILFKESYHFPILLKLSILDISYINKIILASFVYKGIKDLNFSCPAVSYNNKVTLC